MSDAPPASDRPADERPAGADRPDDPAATAWSDHPLLGWMAILLSALYPLVEAVRLIVDSRPQPLYGDTALLDLAARRAGHLDQLVGPYSREGFHHPGPIAFYVMAPFVRALGSGQGDYLAAVVVSGACVVAATALLWRWCNARTALAGVAALGAFELCLRVFTLREPWNPYMIVAPMALLAILAAGAMAGRRGAWAWAAVAGSYAVQTHIAAAPVAVALLLAPVIPAAVRLRRDHVRRPSAVGGAGLLVAVLMWVPSLVELGSDRPNNLRLLWDFYRTSHGEPSWHEALKAAGNALAIFPFGNEDYVNELIHPRWELVATFVGVVLVAVAALVLAWVRRRGLPAALVASAAIVAVVGTLGLKRASGGINAYFATWMAAAPLLVVLALVVVLIGTGPRSAAVRPAAHERARPHPSGRVTLVVVTALALAAVAGTTHSDLAMRPASEVVLAPQAAAGQMAEQVLARSPRGAVALDIVSSGAWPEVAGVALALDRHGVATVVRPGYWTLYFGDQDRPGRPVASQYSFYTTADAQADHVPAGSVLVSSDDVVMAEGPPPAGVVPQAMP